MSERKREGEEQGYSEADVADILERAIKLDGARDTRVTVDQIREAAMEVGVSPEAFSQALTEFSGEHAPTDEVASAPTPAPRFRSLIRSGLAVGFGAALGSIAGVMDGPYLSEETHALAAILLAGASLRLVLSHKKDKALLPYVVDVIWLWSSFVAMVALLTSALAEESIVLAVAGILIASVVGGWILKKSEPTETTRTVRLELTAPRDKAD